MAGCAGRLPRRCRSERCTRSGRSSARTTTTATSRSPGGPRRRPSSSRRLCNGRKSRASRESRARRRSRPPAATLRHGARSSSATIRRSMGFAEDANALIQQKKFDDLESLWMNQMESDPADVDAFLRIAKALRKAEQRTQSDTLLGLLSDTLLEKKLWLQRLQVLKKIGRLSKHPATLR